ncbi:MSCRAMM family adhesin SdrC [Natribaculum luteum]|uniref:MSCRAMM family adhesin SdrC n=1 Tax=Natribaculum luteum TaxID=1586232 RepID=A0ABD5NW84_9EURY|nr:MSCRAMM family adhesin SdrC [Natribaculum luteum]
MTERYTRVASTILALTLVLSACALTGVAASDEASLSVPGSIDTPTKTVSIEGTEYEVSSVAVREPGQSLPVDVSASDSTDFRVDLYNSDEQRENSQYGTGSERVTFDTDALDPGTYLLMLQIDDDYVEIHPVVISGYDVETDHADEIEPDETLNATISVTPTAADGDPEGVELVVWNDETTIRESAEQTDDGTYEATVSDLEEGTYDVYAIAQGGDEIDGEHEILGVSDGGSLEVAESTSEPTPPDDGDDGSEDDDSDNESDPVDDGDADNVSDGESENVSDGEPDNGSDNETDVIDDPVDGDEGNETTDSDDGADNDSSSESNETSEVVMPTNETNETDAGTEDDPGAGSDSVPLEAVPILVFALVIVGVSTRVTRR